MSVTTNRTPYEHYSRAPDKMCKTWLWVRSFSCDTCVSMNGVSVVWLTSPCSEQTTTLRPHKFYCFLSFYPINLWITFKKLKLTNIGLSVSHSWSPLLHEMSRRDFFVLDVTKACTIQYVTSFGKTALWRDKQIRLMNIDSEHLCRSICSFNLSHYHKHVKIAELGWHCSFLEVEYFLKWRDT